MSSAGHGDEAKAPGDLKPWQGAVPPADQLGTIGQLRASHQDRDRVVEMLRVAAGDGRLTAEELDERLEAALTARTYAELAVLTTDLPAASAPGPPGAPPGPVGAPGRPSGQPVPEPKDVSRIDCGSGSSKRDGHWMVPRRLEVRVSSGEVVLDFTDAVISQPSLHLDAEVHSGQLTLITKPGIAVDADEVQVRSGQVKIMQPWGHGATVGLRIVVTGTIGSGRLLARPPRRTLWQWLTRRPARAAAPR